jgi:nitroreductase
MDLATVDHLFTTTRCVRKRLDFSRKVEPTIIERCIEIAIQAPTGGNAQNFNFVVVTEADKRAAIARIARETWDAFDSGGDPLNPYPESDLRYRQYRCTFDSARYLIKHLDDVPVLIFCCIELRPGLDSTPALWGSILPAAWSLMLALRARGLGSTRVTGMLQRETDLATFLGIPENVKQAVVFPVAYFKGRIKPAKRLPARNFHPLELLGREARLKPFFSRSVFEVCLVMPLDL